jgi:hypothetical protein
LPPFVLVLGFSRVFEDEDDENGEEVRDWQFLHRLNAPRKSP